MLAIFKCYLCTSNRSLYANFVFGYLRLQLVLIGSLSILSLWEAKLLAAKQGELGWRIAKVQFEDELLLKSPLSIKGTKEIKNAEKLKPEKFLYPNKLPVLMAGPENFNPGLQIPPPSPPKLPKDTNPPASAELLKSLGVLENIQTDYRYDTDNFHQNNLFIEPTAEFRLTNGNRVFLKTGYDYFSQPHVKSVTNIPFQLGWEGKIGEVILHTAAGIDFFDHLPTSGNLSLKVEGPISSPKVSPSGRLLSVVSLSGNLEYGPFKSNARTLDNQISAWRFGPDLYWQINRNTSLFSSLRLGNYNDGNSEVQSFSRLERKLGQFSVAANLFTWSYDKDLERKSGYFSPPDFLVYNGELGWQGDIFKFLGCRVAASLGQQRLKGKFDNANTYQTQCTVKISPSIEADLGYAFSNVRSHQTGGSSYGGNSITGQVRIKF